MLLRSALLLVFFSSGFAALVYQIIWQRLLTFITGTDTQSVTIIVASVMAGLGIGSVIGGYAADRLSNRARLRLFAICELAVAAFAFISVPLFYNVLYERLGTHEFSAIAATAFHAGATLWPTMFMGLAFPLMARAIQPDSPTPSRWISLAFGVNTLGAAVGAFVTIRWLMSAMDFASIVQVGVAVNTACAVVAIAASRHVSDSRPSPGLGMNEQPADQLQLSFRRWLALFALSGFIALALEIIWFRILGVVLLADARTFGRMLALYLGGLALGAIVSQTRLVSRWPATTAYLCLQAAVPLYSGAAIATVALFSYIPLSGWVVPIAMMSVPTFLMGLSFGCMQRAAQTNLSRIGRRVGWLQFANIAGTVAGALATGFVLIDALGSMGTVRLLIAGGSVFTWSALRASPIAGRGRRALVTVVAAAVCMIALPNRDALWSRLHHTDGAHAIVEANSSGIAVLTSDASSTQVSINGFSQSDLPYRGVQTDLGLVPTMLHPNPVRIAIIGLGSGNTTFSAGGRIETQRVDTIEIVEPLIDALRKLAVTQAYPALSQLLIDPRMRYRFTDGRAFLSKTGSRYDIIEADALRPDRAHAGNIYSVEYFSLLRTRLNAGGYAVTWLPTPRVRESLRAAFPYVRIWGELGIGSESPILVNASTVRRRLAHPYTQAYFRAAGIDAEAVMADYLTQAPESFSPADARPLAGDVNEDLFPRDEFHVQQR